MTLFVLVFNCYSRFKSLPEAHTTIHIFNANNVVREMEVGSDIEMQVSCFIKNETQIYVENLN